MNSPPASRFSLRSSLRLATSEGWENRAYLDIRGLQTIGAGHLLTSSELMSGKIKIADRWVKWCDGLTNIEVLHLLYQDIALRESVLHRLVAVPLNQNQFDALLMFLYNIGATAFAESTLLRLLNDGQYDQVPVQMRRWIYADGKVVEGLIDRRDAEAALWSEAGHE